MKKEALINKYLAEINAAERENAVYYEVIKTVGKDDCLQLLHIIGENKILQTIYDGVIKDIAELD